MNRGFQKKILAMLCVCSLLLSAPFSAFALTYEEIYGDLNTLGYQIDTKKLASFADVRPRLLLNADKLAAIDALRVSDDSYMQNANYKVLTRARWGIENDPPETIDTASYDSFFSYIYEYLPSLALCYLLTGEQQYMDGAAKWMEAACSYPVWEDKPDLAIGFGLTALAYGYDWLHEDLDSTLRAKVRAKLLEQGRIVYEYMSGEKQRYNRMWLQNHMWIPLSGMACAGAALYGEESATEDWLMLANNHFSTTASLLPSDGFGHEGMDYFFYGMESLFVYMALSEELLGVNLYNTDFFRNVSDYVLYQFYPRSAWQSDAFYSNIGDASGKSLKDHLILLAATKNRDGYAQWLAKELAADNVTSGHYFYRMLWYDPELTATAPEGKKALLKHFADLDVAVSRTGWDGNENMLIFKSGLPMGKTEQAVRDSMETVYDFGAAHVHPDNNHFILYGNGELLLRDDNYTVPKYTSQHNTLTVDDVGQLGDDDRWFDILEWDAAGGSAQIKKVQSSDGFDYIVGDAAGSYRAESGVKKFDRHLIFLKPDILIVVDDIELEEAKSMKLRFWPKSQDITETANGYTVAGTNTTMHITDLSGDTKASTTETVWLNTVTEERKSISFSKTAQSWVSVKAISWSDNTETPAAVTCQQSGDDYIFFYHDYAATLDLSAETVDVQETPRYDITYTVSGQGTVTPQTAQVMKNRTLEFTAAAADGWYVSEVKVNGVPYVIDDHRECFLSTVITQDTAVEVVFEEVLIPPTVQTVEKTFTNPGYGGILFGKLNIPDGRATPTEFGYLFSKTNQTPMINNSARLRAMTDANLKGQFGIQVTGGGILPGITYFARPYLLYQAYGQEEVQYGKPIAFTPQSVQVNAFLQTFGFGTIPFTAYEIAE